MIAGGASDGDKSATTTITYTDGTKNSSSFDFFGERSHSDYTKTLSKTQIQNRTTLKNLMVENGFAPLKEEWWHFTLVNEPYPDTYFDFPISEVKETRGYCKNQ